MVFRRFVLILIVTLAMVSPLWAATPENGEAEVRASVAFWEPIQDFWLSVLERVFPPAVLSDAAPAPSDTGSELDRHRASIGMDVDPDGGVLPSRPTVDDRGVDIDPDG